MAYLVASGSTGNTIALSNTWLENPNSALKTSRRRTDGTGTCGTRSSPHTVIAEATMLAKTMRSTNGASHGRRSSTRATSPEIRSLRVHTKQEIPCPTARSMRARTPPDGSLLAWRNAWSVSRCATSSPSRRLLARDTSSDTTTSTVPSRSPVERRYSAMAAFASVREIRRLLWEHGIGDQALILGQCGRRTHEARFEKPTIRRIGFVTIMEQTKEALPIQCFETSSHVGPAWSMCRSSGSSHSSLYVFDRDDGSAVNAGAEPRRSRSHSRRRSSACWAAYQRRLIQ